MRIGYEPNTELFAGQVDMDSSNHILVGANCATSVPGVLVVGDICNSGYPRLATAAGHGVLAAAAVNRFVRSERTNLAPLG